MTQPASQPIKASIFMLGAMASFTLMAIAGRALAPVLDTFEIMMYRSFIGITIVLGLAVFNRKLGEIPTGRIGLHATRNLFHFAGQNLWFFALIYIPLSQLFAFEFTHPLWVAILAPFFLGEKMTATRVFSFILGFVGILIIARPESAPLSFATLAAALCALMFAFTTLSTKKLSKTESTTCILFWLTCLQGVFGVICAGYDLDIAVPSGIALLWVTLVGICGLIAHFCITTALRLAPATVVAPMEFARLPLAAVVAWALYGEPLVIAIFVGAGVVFAANYLNLRAETRANRPSPLP